MVTKEWEAMTFDEMAMMVKEYGKRSEHGLRLLPIKIARH
jgi:hypothetical protein